MTVIAWDGVTLAADRQAERGGIMQPTRKLHRVGDALVGFCGPLTHCLELLRWFTEGAKHADFPASCRDSDASLLIVTRDDSGQVNVSVYEGTPVSFKLEANRVAIGSGSGEALVAMRCGKDAKEAVEITCEVVSSCGMGVDTLTFH